MPIQYTSAQLRTYLAELKKLSAETEWVEFKHNNADPHNIGEYLSGLANSAALMGKAYGYMVWGLEDETRAVLGTSFAPHEHKIGNEELESWLLRQLSPRLDFCFYEVLVDGKRVVILEIPAAFRHPVKFQSQEYVRVGSYKKKLKDYPEKERELWKVLDNTPFEHLVAMEAVPVEEVLRVLDYATYFDLMKRPLPEGREGILDALQQERFIQPHKETGLWDVMNLGAVLFAKNFDDFLHLRRKAVRVTHYKGKNKFETIRGHEEMRGYAVSYEALVNQIMSYIPSNEIIESALRKDVPLFPELAVRELVANAIIHQDLSERGTSPTVEIYEDRIEVMNPGKPLIDTNRFLDNPPRSRNERMAAFLKRIGVCEERGSGIDKVVIQTEVYQLPPPRFEVVQDHTKAVFFAYKEFKEMDKEDRVRACYLHSVLCYLQGEFMTNSSFRGRLEISEQNKSIASRIIRDTVTAGFIAPYDPNASKKFMKYVPSWTK